jgi:glycosyltransferase involved in cell wall biosynthesis
LRIGVDYTAAVNQTAGIGRYVRSLFQAVADIDHVNQYVLVYAAPNAGRAPETPDVPNMIGRELRFRERTMNAVWHRLRLPIPVDLVTGAVDIFHAPDFILPPVRRARRMITVHDLAFLIHPECADERLRSFLEQTVPRSAERADFILADSENTRNDVICLLDADPERVFVVPCGVDPSFRPAAEEVVAETRRWYELPRPYILSVGVIEPRKNFPRLIDAYTRFRQRTGSDLQLAIAGGKGWLYEETYREAERSPYCEDIRLLGYVPEQHLAPLYTGADAFAYPSLYEGFGMPVLEAMACGTPVVCSNTSSFPEFATGAAAMVPPDDIDAIARGLEQVCTDETLRANLRAEGFKRAMTFNWHRSAEQLLQVYEHVRGAA